MRTPLTILLLCLGMPPLATAELTNTWYLRGPDGGFVRNIGIDAVSQRPTAGGAAGLFTYDGSTWNYSNAGLNDGPSIGDIAASSNATFVVNDSRVARSGDGGATWAYVTPKASDGSALDYHVASIAASRASAVRVYAAINFGNGDTSGGLYVSSDVGNTWTQSAPTAGLNAALVRVSQTNPNLVFVATALDGAGVAKLLRSSNGGTSFDAMPAFQTSGYRAITDIAQDPFDATRVIAVTDQDSELLVSSNSGATFVNQGTPFAINGFLVGGPVAVLFDRAVSGVVYFATWEGLFKQVGAAPPAIASTGMLQLGMNASGATVYDALYGVSQGPDGTLYAASSSNGVYRSTDRATNWSSINLGYGGRNFRILAFQPGWVSPNPKIVLAGQSDPSEDGLVYRSADGGTTWTSSTIGIQSAALRGIAFSPVNPNIALAAGFRQQSIGGETNKALWRSTDAGQTWTAAAINSGLHSSDRRNILFDPYDVTGQRVLLSSANSINISTDAGQTWVNSIDNAASFSGLPFGCYAYMLGLGASPGPTSGTRIYASFGAGDPGCLGNVYISDDGGHTWSYSSAGLPGPPDDTTLQFATSSTPGMVFVTKVAQGSGMTGGIYRSTDFAATWSKTSSGLTSDNIFHAVADPGDPSVAWAASTYIAADQPGGIFRTANANDPDPSRVVWRPYGFGLRTRNVMWLTIDPADHNHVLAGSHDGIYEMHYSLDSDQDGQPDSAEAQFNGGDANNDGISDATQSDVASTPVPTFTPTLARAVGALTSTTDYVVVSIDKTKPYSGDCNTVSELGGVPTNEIPHSTRMAQSAWTIRFVLPSCQLATVKIRYSALVSDPAAVFGSYSPTLPGVFTTQTWGFFPSSQASLDPLDGSWTIALDQNGYGNGYALNTGSILFQGAPGRDSIFRDGFE